MISFSKSPKLFKVNFQRRPFKSINICYSLAISKVNNIIIDIKNAHLSISSLADSRDGLIKCSSINFSPVLLKYASQARVRGWLRVSIPIKDSIKLWMNLVIIGVIFVIESVHKIRGVLNPFKSLAGSRPNSKHIHYSSFRSIKSVNSLGQVFGKLSHVP